MVWIVQKSSDSDNRHWFMKMPCCRSNDYITQQSSKRNGGRSKHFSHIRRMLQRESSLSSLTKRLPGGASCSGQQHSFPFRLPSTGVFQTSTGTVAKCHLHPSRTGKESSDDQTDTSPPYQLMVISIQIRQGVLLSPGS